MANGANVDNRIFIPHTFHEFLRMLSKTRLDSDFEYKITFESIMCENPADFSTMLKFFATSVYENRPVNEKKLSKFYQDAYAIRKKAIDNKHILDQDPDEFV